MSTTNVTLRIPQEVLERIDHNATQAGETRNDRMLQWLPAYYSDDDGPQPDPVDTTGMSMVKISLRVPDDTLDRINASAFQAGIARTEYILRWQPECHRRHTNNHQNDPASTTR
jgi:predicted DNA binding CopG/RHH family protein